MDIDAVVMWVDGSDPEWLKEKNKYAPVKVDDSNSANRFRDWGLMKYWFRSIEKYLPWIRKIHFVTWGHTPDFLKLDHPKLNIVRHEEFIPEEYLPTFSSHTIELNLFRIKDLSEHFVFFNDDMFVNKPLPETYFFKDGIPCSHYAEIPFGFLGNLEVWHFATLNDLWLINKHFNKSVAFKKWFSKYVNPAYRLKDNVRSFLIGLLVPDYFTGFISLHSPAAYCKATFAELWDEEYEVLHNTSTHKFRSNEDVNQWLALWWQIASGNFMPQRMNCCTFVVSDDSIDSICSAIEKQSYDMICINDPCGDTDFEVLSARLHQAFEQLLPDKCGFEK